MYDAWAAYDATAAQDLHQEKASVGNVESARREAISYAAYNVILHRFVTGPAGVGPGRSATVVNIRQQTMDLEHDPDRTMSTGRRFLSGLVP